MEAWQFLVGIDGFFSVEEGSEIGFDEKRIRMISTKMIKSGKVEELLDRWFFKRICNAITLAANKFARTLMKNLPRQDDLQYEDFKIVSIQKMHLRFGMFVTIYGDDDKIGYTICSPLDTFDSQGGYDLAIKRYKIVDNIYYGYEKTHSERSGKTSNATRKSKQGHDLPENVFEVKGVIQNRSESINMVTV